MHREVIVKSLSKVWSLLALVFAAAALLLEPSLQSALGTLLGANVAAKLIAGAVAVAAFSKGLPDADHDGKPDFFDDTPNGESTS